MPRLSSRDWVISKLKDFDNVVELAPVSDDFILIHRKKNAHSDEEYPSFTTAVISTKNVTENSLNHLFDQEQDFKFVTNIPKDTIWTSSAIALAQQHNLGWGGVGDLMSALGQKDVEGFQRKEYDFVERGLNQHTRVFHFDRLFDRLIEIHRHNLSSIKTVLLNEYELTAEHIRHARAVYGEFSAVLRTNPNGGATENAHSVAKELGAEIFQWGEFLG